MNDFDTELPEDTIAEMKRLLMLNEWLKADMEEASTKLTDQLLIQQKEIARLIRENTRLEKLNKNMTVEEFFGQRAVVMWKVGQAWEGKEKCDKCDKNRDVAYRTPLGKATAEKCDCAVKKSIYSSKKIVLQSLEKDSKTLRTWFKMGGSDGYTGNQLVTEKDIYDPSDPFEKLLKYNVFFKYKTDCVHYCDWLNSPGSM